MERGAMDMPMTSDDVITILGPLSTKLSWPMSSRQVRRRLNSQRHSHGSAMTKP